METLNNNQQTTGLKIFNNSEIGARIRATTERNETWFVAQDICDILNLKIQERRYSRLIWMKNMM